MVFPVRLFNLAASTSHLCPTATFSAGYRSSSFSGPCFFFSSFFCSSVGLASTSLYFHLPSFVRSPTTVSPSSSPGLSSLVVLAEGRRLHLHPFLDDLLPHLGDLPAVHRQRLRLLLALERHGHGDRHLLPGHRDVRLRLLDHHLRVAHHHLPFGRGRAAQVVLVVVRHGGQGRQSRHRHRQQAVPSHDRLRIRGSAGCTPIIPRKRRAGSTAGVLSPPECSPPAIGIRVAPQICRPAGRLSTRGEWTPGPA